MRELDHTVTNVYKYEDVFLKYGGLARCVVGTIMILVYYSARVVIFREAIIGNFKGFRG